MLENDRQYYQHRADIEQECARRASDPCAVEVHTELAKAYRTKLARHGVAGAG